MFDAFKVSSFYVENPSILSLYSTERTTGIVFESEDGVTQIAPIYEGYSLSHSIIKLDFGGRDLTEWMLKLLIDEGYEFSLRSKKEIVRDIKEKLSYVVLDFEAEMKKQHDLQKLIDHINFQMKM
jgi:actin-related protein